MATQLISKSANRFGTWEVLYLFDCHCPHGGETLHGSFMITEVKHQTDETVTFIVRRVISVEDDGQPALDWKTTHMLEFRRGAVLHRVTGALVTTIIVEPP